MNITDDLWEELDLTEEHQEEEEEEEEIDDSESSEKTIDDYEVADYKEMLDINDPEDDADAYD